MSRGDSGRRADAMSGVNGINGATGESRADAAIIELSRFYGRDPEWIIAGGGNASVKDERTLWIKASGTALGEASPNTFVAIDRSRLSQTWAREYPAAVDAREKEALEDLMTARWDGETLRPSVETGMHEAIPARYVLHTHPTVVNGITCSVDGESVVHELFGDEAIWIPSINPGYVLSKRIYDEFTAIRGSLPFVFLQNHGLTVAADTVEEIYHAHRRILQTVLQHLRRLPDCGAAETDIPRAGAIADRLKRGFREVTGKEGVILFEATAELIARSASRDQMTPLMEPFSPDHIVYAGVRPLYIEDGEGDIAKRYIEGAETEGVPPRVVVVRGIGAFALGPSRKAAETTRMLFRDAVTIAAYAESFGGARGMDSDQVDFIRNWEVERFRAKVSLDG